MRPVSQFQFYITLGTVFMAMWWVPQMDEGAQSRFLLGMVAFSLFCGADEWFRGR